MPSDPLLIEELTAYLDGELEATEVQRVEQRLSTDPEYRAEMQALQRTWDLFDRLPDGHASSNFTQSTMEIVVQDAVKQIYRKRNRWWLWPVRLSLLAAVPLSLFAIGFFVTRQIQLEPNRQLITNLPFIENFDRYEKIENNLEFLVKLDEEGLFSGDKMFYDHGDTNLPVDIFIDDQPGHPASRDTMEDRQRYIESLDLEQKNQLARKNSDFGKLTAKQQNEFRQFHDELASHSDRASLTRVMNLYYDWLKTLGLTEQARLLDLLPIEKRIAEIDKIKYRQAQEAFGVAGSTKLPTARDAEYLFIWLNLAISSKEERIRVRFPKIVADYLQKNNREVSLVQLSLIARRRPLNQLVADLIRIDRNFIQDLVFQDVDLLRRGLSFEARAIFDEQSPQEQKDLVLNWIISAIQSRSSISPEELQAFYVELPFEERDKLDKMAPENWRQALEAKFRARNSTQNGDATDSQDDWRSFLDDNGLGSF